MPSLPCFNLDNKVVVVTGAGRGIGRQNALDAAQSGASLAVGSRTVEDLVSLKSEIESMGGECWYGKLDATNIDSIKGFIASAVERYGRIDALINNAGFNRQKDIIDYTEEEFDRIIDANLKSVFFCSQLVARQMMKQGNGGSIVNITSQAGVVGAPKRGPYSGAKAGVNNMTKTMAAEWGKFDIRVNAVAPTVTRTEMTKRAMSENAAWAQTAREKILLPVDAAEPEEISAPVIFLTSAAASMITGHTLVVDGGWTIV